MAAHDALAAAEAALEAHRRRDAAAEYAVNLDRVVDPEPAQQCLWIVVRHLVVGDVRVHLERVYARVAQARTRHGERERVRRLPRERADHGAWQLQPVAEQRRRNPGHDRAGGQGVDSGRATKRVEDIRG